jgi:hypothetical protein
MRVTRLGPVLFVFLAAGCGDDDPAVPDAGPTCELDTTFDTGGEGVAAPLAAVGPDRAAAGRLAAGDLPAVPSGLATWAPGDFVLANDRVAMVIEDVGASDLYDPWGGRPVGIALVEGGALTAGGDFGEFLVLTGRHSVVTTSVGVIADGADGGPAIVRAVGVPAPTPFFENITGALFREAYEDVPTAIDYVLEPGADHVDIRVHHRSPRTRDAAAAVHHARHAVRRAAAGVRAGRRLRRPLHRGRAVPGVHRRRRRKLRLRGARPHPRAADRGLRVRVDGDRGLHRRGLRRDQPRLRPHLHRRPGARSAARRGRGRPRQRAAGITGTVENADGTPAAGVRVHATRPDGGYLTRALTGADGSYALHVPAGGEIELHAWRRGDGVPAPVTVAAGPRPRRPSPCRRPAPSTWSPPTPATRRCRSGSRSCRRAAPPCPRCPALRRAAGSPAGACTWPSRATARSPCR